MTSLSSRKYYSVAKEEAKSGVTVWIVTTLAGILLALAGAGTGLAAVTAIGVLVAIAAFGYLNGRLWSYLQERQYIRQAMASARFSKR